RPPRTGARPVLVYGAGGGGELVLRELRNNAALGGEAGGFIDDGRPKAGARECRHPPGGPRGRFLDTLRSTLNNDAKMRDITPLETSWARLADESAAVGMADRGGSG